jgi:hypothetical protein
VCFPVKKVVIVRCDVFFFCFGGRGGGGVGGGLVHCTKKTYRWDAVRNLAPLDLAMDEEPLSKPSKKSSNAVAVVRGRERRERG